MNNNLPFYRNKAVLYKILILFVILLSFPFTGSDCENNIIGNGTSGSLIGTWELVSIQGNLQDVCAGETVKYDTTGIATLQCPNQNPITRSYTVSNNILTYTETSIQYDITTLSSTALVLEGRNVGRILSYSRLPADKVVIPVNTKQGSNSSETNVKERQK
jgi:hypothetical protein